MTWKINGKYLYAHLEKHAKKISKISPFYSYCSTDACCKVTILYQGNGLNNKDVIEIENITNVMFQRKSWCNSSSCKDECHLRAIPGKSSILGPFIFSNNYQKWWQITSFLSMRQTIVWQSSWEGSQLPGKNVDWRNKKLRARKQYQMIWPLWYN